MNYAQILQLFMHVIRLIGIRKSVVNEHYEDMTVMSMYAISVKFMLDFSNILMLLMRYMKMKDRKKKKISQAAHINQITAGI